MLLEQHRDIPPAKRDTGDAKGAAFCKGVLLKHTGCLRTRPYMPPMRAWHQELGPDTEICIPLPPPARRKEYPVLTMQQTGDAHQPIRTTAPHSGYQLPPMPLLPTIHHLDWLI